MSIPIESIKSYLTNLQLQLCQAFETLEPSKRFIQDNWNREIGAGRACVMESGEVFEKAGVNYSCVIGDKLPPSATAHRPDLVGSRFQAMGVSVVIHPVNPFVPTAHANVRFFIAEKEGQPPIWWFGGGFDLTPYYGFEEDAIHFHQTAKKACDPFDPAYYPRFKKWCDDYFYLKHRQEPRGIGGLFFDDFHEKDMEFSFDFMQSIGDHFILAYLPIVKRRYDVPYTEKHRQFQTYRRGRYVEFNLVYDRGTLFGLQSGGRTESILMSMPPAAAWQYDWHPEAGSTEEKLYTDFLRPRDWVDL